MNNSCELSIIMPCLNEEETLGICIDKALKFLKDHGIAGEVVIGDNGSTDNSIKIAQDKGVRVINVPIKGYGAALFYATQESNGKYVIMGDSDDSYDFSNLMPFVEKLREGYDLVMGNRFKGGVAKGAMPWKNRYIGNPVLTFIGKMLFKSDVNDFHCGLRGFSKEAFYKMDLRTTGMEFASEMVIKSTLFHLKVIEVPTTLNKDGRSRPPHLKPWRDGWRHLRFLLLYSPNWLFSIPGISGMVIGIMMSIFLIIGQQKIFGINFDIHTLVYSIFLVLISFNILIFGIYTRIYTYKEGLIPISHKTSFFINKFKLEHGLIIGTLFVLIGIGATVFAVLNWENTNFGNLDPARMMRIVLPSCLSLMIGIQIIFSSFFYSVLFLSVKR